MGRASLGLMSIAVVAGLACRSPVDGGQTLRASILRDSLRLHNTTERPVYFFVMEEWMVPLANWATCTVPTECPAVESHSIRALSRDDLSIGSDSVTVVVFWWHLVESGDGYREDGSGMARAYFPRTGAAR